MRATRRKSVTEKKRPRQGSSTMKLNFERKGRPCIASLVAQLEPRGAWSRIDQFEGYSHRSSFHPRARGIPRSATPRAPINPFRSEGDSQTPFSWTRSTPRESSVIFYLESLFSFLTRRLIIFLYKLPGSIRYSYTNYLVVQESQLVHFYFVIHSFQSIHSDLTMKSIRFYLAINYGGFLNNSFLFIWYLLVFDFILLCLLIV